MSIIVAVLAIQGGGKTSSYCNVPSLGISGLDPKSTLLISVNDKELKYKGWRKDYTTIAQSPDKKGYVGNYLATRDYGIINQALVAAKSMPNIKAVVIDDANYLMANELIEKVNVTGYDKFTQMAKKFRDMVENCRTLRRDQVVYIMSHVERTEDPNEPYRMQTVGKMLHEKLNIQGLFSIVLFMRKENKGGGEIEHQFVTSYDGEFNAKSEPDMFKEKYIKNDLALVDAAVRDYYEL